jgi:hypothetical protein
MQKLKLESGNVVAIRHTGWFAGFPRGIGHELYVCPPSMSESLRG